MKCVDIDQTQNSISNGPKYQRLVIIKREVYQYNNLSNWR